MAEGGPSTSGDAGDQSVADAQKQLANVNATLDACRNLVLDPDSCKLLRVVKTPTGNASELENLCGSILLQVRSGNTHTDINSLNTLDALLKLMDDTGQSHLVDEVGLVFKWPDASSLTKAEKARAKKNLLYDPDSLQVQLTDQSLLLHLQQRGIRKKIVKDLASFPSGACLYFNHFNWQLLDLGALLRVPPSKIKELDLSENSIKHVGPDLSRFEQLTDLRLVGNGISEIELHYLPRLRFLDLHYNRLKAIPELAGLTALEEIDMCDNDIGSRGEEGGESGLGAGSASPDGWECIAHSELQELKIIRIANNQLMWGQKEFNQRILVLNEKKSIEVLDFRGNPMLFSPRLDDRAPLQMYRGWIITQCSKLEMLDGAEVTEEDHLMLAFNPIIGEPPIGAEADDDDDVAGGGADANGMPEFDHPGQPMATDLGALSDFLSETFVLPSYKVSENLDLVQKELQKLFMVPPTKRYLFPQHELEQVDIPMIGFDEQPTGNDDDEDEEDSDDNDQAPTDGQITGSYGLKEAGRRKRIGYETQLNTLAVKGAADGLMTDAEIASKEDVRSCFSPIESQRISH